MPLARLTGLKPLSVQANGLPHINASAPGAHARFDRASVWV
jgi:hypothetical protein